MSTFFSFNTKIINFSHIASKLILFNIYQSKYKLRDVKMDAQFYCQVNFKTSHLHSHNKHILNELQLFIVNSTPRQYAGKIKNMPNIFFPSCLTLIHPSKPFLICIFFRTHIHGMQKCFLLSQLIIMILLSIVYDYFPYVPLGK